MKRKATAMPSSVNGKEIFVSTSISLTPDLHAKVRRKARERNQSLSGYLRSLIELHLPDPVP